MESLRNRESLQTRKLLIQGFLVFFRLKQVLRKCYIRHHVFVNQYQISVSQKLKRSLCCNHNSAVSRFTTYHQAFDRCNMASTSSAAGNTYPSGTPEFTCHAWEKMRCVRAMTDVKLRTYLNWLYGPGEQKKNCLSNSYLYSSDHNRRLPTR